MTTPAQYIKRIQFIDMVIKMKTEGLTHADSMKQLPFPGNCMNWNLGHILVYREQYLGVLDGVSEADSAEFARYGAGSDPLTDAEKALPLATLLKRIDAVSERLVAAFESISAEKLTEAYESHAGSTIDDHLNFYAIVHEAIHVGQLEILRELALASAR